MELQLVTFEQAKVLKELGFPQDDFYNYYYTEDGKTYWMKMSDDFGNSWGIGQYHFCCVAPTLEAVAKWLREEKHLSIIVEDYECCEDYNTYFSHIINLDIKYFPDMISKDYKCWCERHCGRWESENYKDYEEALFAGINKAIKMLI